MNKTVTVDDRLRNAVTMLHGDRGRSMEAAAEQIHLLERLYAEYRVAVGDVNLVDEITKRPLLEIEWIPATERGAALTVTCLNGSYAFGFEVQYEFGGRIATTSRGGEEASRNPEEFYRQVFRDTPVRLKPLEDGRIGVDRRAGGSVAGVVLLSTFVEAVVMLERMRSS